MRSLLFLIFLLVCQMASAQMEGTYSSYPFSQLAINPAYAGTRDVTSMTFLNRRRSVQFQNTYSSQYFTVDSPVGENWALGFQAFRDPYSVASVGFYGTAAYRHRISENEILSAGVQMGITQVVLPNNFVGNNAYPFTLGFGVQYKTPVYYVGLSTQNLVNQTHYYSTAKPIFLTAGYVFSLTEEWKLKAATLVRGQNPGLGFQTKADVNATFWYKNVGVGVWYQSTLQTLGGRDGILGTAEVQLGDRFRVGASYDFNAPHSGDFSFSTQESTIWQFFLRYELDKGTGKVGQMRYF
ncbi:hypothetical protein BWI93_19960 [Siphonobacter sp. BAB-5385]|uniref:PorP/SprF family type IX secretion system membrane protein n=1 Tax=unclassified Siphonobacter TaxID=2635712 RepID=UPI000B9E001E|nr:MULTISPECIES: PorP/SprF family type IX secretion system membrane protein [unclassified Siphonobacter]OZI06450.1 hypothetical protein BWI93_19960 [Siphonobacter sp. BAB-5385]PMD98183.1 hypothetical protein BWI97_05745 [Siphonobacter sp. BAB-5405]